MLCETCGGGGAVERGKKILLVDDDIDFLAATRTRLESLGFNVTTAESVAEGIERLGEFSPDLAIVDLMLEEDDGGFMLCHHIKKMNAELPIIMCSAVKSETGLDFDAKTDEERAWIHADAWLAKPVRFEQLQSEVTRLLEM